MQAINLLQLYFTRRRQNKEILFNDIVQDFYSHIESLIKVPEVIKLSDFRHHMTATRLDHCLEVAWLSYRLARHFSLDTVSTARGALLHDLFFYEWLTERRVLHGFRHPRICRENAQKITSLSKKEEDIILKHMWPLTFSPPRYMESWIVCFIDTYCTIKDCLFLVKFRLSSSP